MTFHLDPITEYQPRTAQVTWDEANLRFTASIDVPLTAPSLSEIVGARVGVRQQIGILQLGDFEIELSPTRTIRGFDLNAYGTLIFQKPLVSLLDNILPGQNEATYVGDLDGNGRASFEKDVVIEHDPKLGCVAVQFDPDHIRASSKFYELATGIYLALDDSEEIKTILIRYR